MVSSGEALASPKGAAAGRSRGVPLPVGLVPVRGGVDHHPLGDIPLFGRPPLDPSILRRSGFAPPGRRFFVVSGAVKPVRILRLPPRLPLSAG
jgi:hypothetical protein